MTGSIYNIGFIYFLLRNIYKLKKMKKYYLHAIRTYIHAYIHMKHLKIAIILMSVRIIAGIWIIELVQSSFLHLMVQLCLNPVSGLLEVNLCLLLLEWVALFWHLSRQWKEILWAPFSIVLLSTSRWEPISIINLNVVLGLRPWLTCVTEPQTQRSTLCVSSSPWIMHLQVPFIMLGPLSQLHHFLSLISKMTMHVCI